MNLSGNTILITGGSSGIGLEFAKAFVAKKNTVIITGRNPDRLREIKAAHPQIHTIVSDVAQPDSIQDLLRKVSSDFPKLNILINNAGIMNELNFHHALSDQKLSEEIEINLMGPIRMSSAFLPHLKRQSTAALVNVSSGLAFVPLPLSPIYCATKAALHSFTQSLRVQMQKTSVKIFEVAPPATATPLLAKSDESDMKGITIMSVEEMVRQSIAGMERDQLEIRPGQSNQLKFMSRLAPDFILKQLSKSAARMQQA